MDSSSSKTSTSLTSLVQSITSSRQGHENAALEPERLRTSSIFASFMNRSEEIVDDEIGYLSAQGLAGGQVRTEMDALENPA